MTNIWQKHWFWIGLGLVSIGFHLWLIFSGLIPNLVSRPLHMALAAPWIFLFPAQRFAQRLWGAMLTLLAVGACIYIALNHVALSDQYGFLSSGWQTALAVLLLMLVLDMARRSIGWPLPLFATLALLYGLLGQYIPGEFGHPGTPIASFLGTLTIAEGGIWGKLTGVSVSIVAIFVIFGAVLNAGEAGSGFMNVAAAIAGRLKGGAAKVSVLSSALFGSISGSASANVASTGMVTLPAMVGLGYPRRLAAAVEAVASSGGQIMPPLMGAGAFVMVELTGIPYTSIIGAAALPAILFFLAVWVGVDCYASRYALKPLAVEDRPALLIVAKTAAFFLLPFSVLLSFMFLGYTPQYAAAAAILSAVILLVLDINLRVSLRSFGQRMQQAAITSGQQIAMIASIILCASIIVGVLSITGLGIKITSLILSFSGGALWPALLLTALACLVLGMEVPTTAAYVICVSVAGPALIDMGIAPIAVHLFVFWYALLSTITPPVCGGVFIAAGMVGENWLKVAIDAVCLGIGLYFIPLAMIRHPALLTPLETPVSSGLLLLQLGLALWLISRAVIGRDIHWRRVLLLISGLGLFFF